MPPHCAVSDTIHEVAKIEGWGVPDWQQWKLLHLQDAYNWLNLPVGRHSKNIDGIVTRPDPVASVRN
jgi:hypothetical protein